MGKLRKQNDLIKVAQLISGGTGESTQLSSLVVVCTEWEFSGGGNFVIRSVDLKQEQVSMPGPVRDAYGIKIKQSQLAQ